MAVGIIYSRLVVLWLTPNKGTNATGFNALPAGMYNGITQNYIDLYGFTSWWASDVGGANGQATSFYLTYNCDVLRKQTMDKVDGLSVRCVMD